MKKNISCTVVFQIALAFCIAAPFYAFPLPPGKSQDKRAFDVRQLHANPYLLNGFSRKRMSQTRATTPYGYGILNNPNTNLVDSLKIIAVRVEFLLDSSDLTTGNGLFGIFRTHKGTFQDNHEWNLYKKYTDSGYVYDKLPHDSVYFASQLEFVKNYFWKVSRGHLKINYALFPSGGNEEDAYKVSEKMTMYSPGFKKKEESWDEYYYRKTLGLMEFIRDGIKSADADKNMNHHPFKNIRRGPDGVLYEIDPANPSRRQKAAVLVFHAGASYLTDGGWGGYLGQNSPSDMIDAFIGAELFKFFSDTTKMKGIDFDSATRVAGIKVNRNNDVNTQFILDELMMCSETSNQDSLNWGIHGILINQIARQMGIPDLFSTMSGISGVGSFCIMDFAGYSAGRGFIPPWPSAWIRAYMGWDMPLVVEPTTARVLSNVRSVSAAKPGDTTIILIPINSHEYYLVENRQRNLTGNPAFFNYDTLKDFESDKVRDSIVISLSDQVNLKKNVNVIVSGKPGHPDDLMDSVINLDVSIPASGALVWHVDEYIIRDHLAQNVINADSVYRGVSIEEADGIQDLGVMFADAFYHATFDYGGAADIFPHFSSENKTPVNFMGPFTRPSTHSNDGGHTYLRIGFTNKNPLPYPEKSLIADKIFYNIPDSVISVSAEHDVQSVTTVSGWPKRLIPCNYFEPVLCDPFSNGDSSEVAVVDTSGRVYLWKASTQRQSFGTLKEAVGTAFFSINTGFKDTITYLARVPSPASMPTGVIKSLYIPSKNGYIYILRSVDEVSMVWDSIKAGAPLSSYVCNYTGKLWAAGCANGTILFGTDDNATTRTIQTYTSDPVQALALIDPAQGILAAMKANGLLVVTSPVEIIDSLYCTIRPGDKIYPPFTIAVADLEQDTILDIVVADNKHGLWLFNYNPATRQLTYDNEWGRGPNDWAGAYRLDTIRAAIPDNGSSPAIGDLDNDGALDIVIGGTNGIYAFNHRGVLLPDWPAFLDKKFWYQRGSVQATPLITTAPDKTNPLVLFASPTGENATFAVAHIDSTDKKTGAVYFTRKDGIRDSIKGLTSGFIDSLTIFGDSLILPYVTPGGYIDAFSYKGKRPDTIITLTSTGKTIVSTWPLTVGGSITTSPILYDIDKNRKPDIFALADAGWMYRWEFPEQILPRSFIWPQAGNDNCRTFRYSGPVHPVTSSAAPDIEYFYNYPNPVNGSRSTAVVFKYRLSRPASSVRLDIFTYTGYQIVKDKGLPSGLGWNEWAIYITKLGSAVYRCRLEADFNGTKKTKYWKMAVVRGN